jgi:hypothetical protein
MDTPISCSLDQADAQRQLDAWEHVLRAVVVATEWPAPNRVRMNLRATDEAVGVLIALARREAACCPFFRFGFDITTDAMVFTASVPIEAVVILEQFAGIASQ